jgi:hypothetical protein
VKNSEDGCGQENEVKMKGKDQASLLPLCPVQWVSARSHRRAGNRLRKNKIEQDGHRSESVFERGVMQKQGEQGEA